MFLIKLGDDTGDTISINGTNLSTIFGYHHYKIGAQSALCSVEIIWQIDMFSVLKHLILIAIKTFRKPLYKNRLG